MVVFALVNTESSDCGYFIASSLTSMTWNGLPRDLADVLEDVREKGEEVMQLSIGLDGDWFLRTNSRHAAKEVHESPDLVSNVLIFLDLAKSGGLDLSEYEIQFFSFVPDPTGYVTVLHKEDDTLSRCAWRNVPPDLDAMLEREASHGIHHVTVGVNGSYVIIMDSGIVWWDKVPQGLGTLLQKAEDSGRRVGTVSLSLIAETWYFVEFADGGVEYSLPAAWHPTITKHTTFRPPVRHSMSTSYHWTPSPASPASPTSPASPASSVSLVPPTTPTSPLNSPLPMCMLYNSQMFYGNGAWPFMYQYPMYGQPAPVFNHTAVYQGAPPEKNSNMKGKFEVLAGALKVGLAVMNFAGNGGLNGFGGNGFGGNGFGGNGFGGNDFGGNGFGGNGIF